LRAQEIPPLSYFTFRNLRNVKLCIIKNLTIYNFQLNLLVYFIQRGIENKWTFGIATEQSKAEKFDDLIFIQKLKDNKCKYTFVQAKHKQDTGNEIEGNFE